MTALPHGAAAHASKAAPSNDTALPNISQCRAASMDKSFLVLFFKKELLAFFSRVQKKGRALQRGPFSGVGKIRSAP
jgi:hypothetical protein